MKTDKTIRIIITGGTFDKEYDALKGELSFSNTHLPGILETVRSTLRVELQITQLADSLDMTDSDRERVSRACQDSEEDLIVITHGTDTMTLTAEMIARLNMGKTIVLTGAMVPYAVLGSDALFNLGAAISAVQLAAPGVYICMNGRLFSAGTVVKDRSRGIFVSL